MTAAIQRPRRPSTALRACTLLLLASGAQAQPAAYDVDLSAAPAPQVSFAAAEGNYRVTVRMRGPKGTRVALLAEQRRLMAEDIALQGTELVERTVIVNVRQPGLGPLPENATGGTTVRLKPREIGSASWDEKLSLETVGGGAIVSVRADPVIVPTVYLAGDSTVTDQATVPSASWGQYLTRYFGQGVAIANHAESGETLKSFVTEQRLDKVLSALNAGDWVMIQFGHNDQKTQWPQTYAEAATTYRAWLRTYVAEVRRRGATPLLVTSPERRNFAADGRIRPTLAEYAEAMRAVAAEERVALLDLNAMSIRIYEALGPAIAPHAFAEGGNDKTHHNEYGARLLARAVAEAVRTSDLTLTGRLADHLAADTGRFDPTRPPLPHATVKR